MVLFLPISRPLLLTLSRNRVWNIDVLGVLRGRYLFPGFALRIGETAIRNCLRDQLLAIKQEGLDNIGPTPCLLSEIGIPYDMDDRKAYETGDFVSQICALDANHFALEGAGLAYTLWVYTAHNDHQWGDQWNGEDLSIFSLDDHATDASESKTRLEEIEPANLKRALSHSTMSTDRASLLDEVQATRAAEAFVRPAPVHTAGTVLEYGFDLSNVTFTLKLMADKATDPETPTEMFMPPFHFPEEETEVKVSGGKWEYDAERSVLRWWHNEGEQDIKVVGIGRRKIWGGDDEGYVETMTRNYGNCLIM